MSVRFKELIHPNIANISLSFAAAGLLWLKEFFNPIDNTPLLHLFDTKLITSYSLWIGLVTTLFVAYLLFRLLEKFTFLQQRTFLPFLFFILLIGSYPLFHYLTNGLVAAFSLLLCMWQIFSSFHKKIPIREAFNGGMFLSLGYFFCFDFLFLIPFIIICLHIVNNLTFKVFFSTLLGILTPAALIFGCSFWMGQQDSQIQYFITNIQFDFEIWNTNIVSIVLLGIFTIISLIAVMGCLKNRFSSSIAERKNLQVLVWFYAAILIILWVRMGRINEILCSFLMVCSLLLSIFFSTRFSKKNTILFSILVIFQLVTLILGFYGSLS